MQTIQEAKQYLRSNFEKGIDCPCCGQLVKKYPYSLNVSIATTLIEIYKIHKSGWDWIHVNTQIRPTSGGYFSLARHWGLIIQKEVEETDDKRGSGYWKLTDRGFDFVLSKITVPKYVYMFDGSVLGFSDTKTSISKALGKKFSYEELMHGQIRE